MRNMQDEELAANIGRLVNNRIKITDFKCDHFLNILRICNTWVDFHLYNMIRGLKDNVAILKT